MWWFRYVHNEAVCEGIGISASNSCHNGLLTGNHEHWATSGQHVNVHGCFFHLCQSICCKIQQLGLTQVYRDNATIKEFCPMINVLTFLPVSDVPAGMADLRQSVPSGDFNGDHDSPFTYFDAMYVRGTACWLQRPVNDSSGNSVPVVHILRSPPLFPPPTWNVHEATLSGTDRTNNQCEEWNWGFASVVSHCHLPLSAQSRHWSRMPQLRMITLLQCTRSQLYTVAHSADGCFKK